MFKTFCSLGCSRERKTELSFRVKYPLTEQREWNVTCKQDRGEMRDEQEKRSTSNQYCCGEKLQMRSCRVVQGTCFLHSYPSRVVSEYMNKGTLKIGKLELLEIPSMSSNLRMPFSYFPAYLKRHSFLLIFCFQHLKKLRVIVSCQSTLMSIITLLDFLGDSQLNHRPTDFSTSFPSLFPWFNGTPQILRHGWITFPFVYLWAFKQMFCATCELFL